MSEAASAVPGSRRAALAEAATDYVLEHGLITLSLRPLAAAVGTSDRMLLYHFADKDDLVATVLRTSTERAVAAISALPDSPDVHSAVLDLWQAVNTVQLARCQRLYVEAAALGVLGQEPYVTVVAEANEVWLDSLSTHLQRSGLPLPTVRRAANLIDAAFMGLQLDLEVDGATCSRDAVQDLADAVARLWA